MTVLLDTFGEKMSEAGTNTIVGMGTVFAALILISLIISCFSIIPKIQGHFQQKAENKLLKQHQDTYVAPVKKEEADNQDEYEDVDDTELVAVITAALMAYIGDEEASDGLVVRSIRKKNNKWKNA